jgi:Ca-activated chloride channel family protein
MRRILLTIIMILTGATALRADGMIIPRPAPWMPPDSHVNVKYHDVEVTINDPVALTRIDQIFVNPFEREIEADYIFPIPENAAISHFTAWLGGHKMEAELLDAARARKIYEDIVRVRRDPALLEYSSQGMYRLRVYPIPARGEVRIQIEYEQTLKSDNGTVEYTYPLNTEKYSGSNLERCKVAVDVKSFEDIGSLYCPTHQMNINRLGAREMKAIYDDENVKPDKDLTLYFTRQTRDFGFHLMSYREPGQSNGFFLGILSPPLENRDNKTNKNMILILDSSGSMRGEKMRQAIDALKYCLNGLNPGDKFNVIDYDDIVRPFKPGLISASRVNIDDASKFADKVEAAGGTNIYDALAEGCRMLRADDNPSYILFLTDGQPTVGNTDLEQIIRNTTNLNEGRARLFVFGVGYDVNTNLLDRLVEQNHGLTEYVLPAENIEVKVSRLASKISHPALTDVSLSFGRSNVSYVYPDPTPDLFYGSEIIFTGRYDHTGSSQAIVSGKVGTKNVTYEFPVRFIEGGSRDDFIALLWANRRIGYLLQELKSHGSNQELLTEVIDLSKKYGIITEYTSFLVTGDEASRRHDIALESRDISRSRAGSIDKKMAPWSGESAVKQSKNIQAQNQLKVLSAPMAFSALPDVEGVPQRQVVTQVGAQGFFQVGNNWIQGNLTGDKFDLQIKRFSKAYFQLIEKDPSLGKYLGLGDEVRIQVGPKVVQVAETGQETLSESDLRMLFPNK